MERRRGLDLRRDWPFRHYARDFAEDLRRLWIVDRLTIRINSRGGFVDDAVVIYNMLLDYKGNTCGKITARIERLAGSGASLIAMAADRIEMPEASWMMIHDPAPLTTITMGPRAEKLCAELLRDDRDYLVNVYARRSGQSKDAVSKLMAANNGQGTWMDARRAVELGFADVVISLFDPLPNAAARRPRPWL